MFLNKKQNGFSSIRPAFLEEVLLGRNVKDKQTIVQQSCCFLKDLIFHKERQYCLQRIRYFQLSRYFMK